MNESNDNLNNSFCDNNVKCLINNSNVSGAFTKQIANNENLPQYYKRKYSRWSKEEVFLHLN